MNGVDNIRRLEDRRSRSEDILDEREDRLYDAVMPAFRAAKSVQLGRDYPKGCTWALKLYWVKITDTEVIAVFGHPDDGGRKMSLPHSVFDADDPVDAATRFQKQRTADEKRESRKRERQRLVNRLNALDCDTPEHHERNDE